MWNEVTFPTSHILNAKTIFAAQYYGSLVRGVRNNRNKNKLVEKYNARCCRTGHKGAVLVTCCGPASYEGTFCQCFLQGETNAVLSQDSAFGSVWFVDSPNCGSFCCACSKSEASALAFPQTIRICLANTKIYLLHFIDLCVFNDFHCPLITNI